MRGSCQGVRSMMTRSEWGARVRGVRGVRCGVDLNRVAIERTRFEYEYEYEAYAEKASRIDRRS
jgi:hypothetical protein